MAKVSKTRLSKIRLKKLQRSLAVKKTAKRIARKTRRKRANTQALLTTKTVGQTSIKIQFRRRYI